MELGKKIELHSLKCTYITLNNRLFDLINENRAPIVTSIFGDDVTFKKTEKYKKNEAEIFQINKAIDDIKRQFMAITGSTISDILSTQINGI